MTALLIAGTDTGVGKTMVTTALASYYLTYRPKETMGLIKLMQTGMGDEEHYRSLFAENPQIEVITPLRFAEPLAPPLSAAKEGKSIDLKVVWQAFNNVTQKHPFTLIEGLGGLGSPVTDELTLGDLAGSWHLPIILVVPVKLGAIAQAVVNVNYARSCKIALKGIILSDVNGVSPEDLANWTPIDLIESLTQIPVLGICPHLDPQNLIEMPNIVSDWAVEWIF